jgi:zinc protease
VTRAARLGLVATFVLSACGPRAVPASPADPWTASGLDWSRPPAIAIAQLVPPRLEEVRLPNGIRVVVVENHRLPIVAIAAIHLAAGGREDGVTPGIAALTADLLDEGAGAHDRHALAEALEHGGARLEIHVATDHASVQLVALADGLPATLPLFADVIRRPRLTDDDLARVRGERVAELTERHARPRTIAAQVFDRVVFGAHPYGRPAVGTAAEVSRLTAPEVRAFWARAYRPDAMTLIVTGAITRADAVRQLAHAFGDWAGPRASAAKAPPIEPFAPRLAYVDVPGATQAVVLVGRRGAPAGAPDQLALALADTVVGGGPGARLDRRLHGELGVALGAGASSWRGRWAGSWGFATTFRTEAAVESLRAALAVIEETRTTELPADELDRARATLLRGAATAFDTTAGTMRVLERLVVQDLPLDWYATYAARLRAITPAAVHAAVSDAWRDLAIVVVGDWRRLAPGLTALGLPVVAYTADAVPVP